MKNMKTTKRVSIRLDMIFEDVPADMMDEVVMKYRIGHYFSFTKQLQELSFGDRRFGRLRTSFHNCRVDEPPPAPDSSALRVAVDDHGKVKTSAEFEEMQKIFAQLKKLRRRLEKLGMKFSDPI